MGLVVIDGTQYDDERIPKHVDASGAVPIDVWFAKNRQPRRSGVPKVSASAEQVPEVVEAPEAPEAEQVPEVAEAPEAEQVPEVAEAPEAEQVPEVAETAPKRRKR